MLARNRALSDFAGSLRRQWHLCLQFCAAIFLMGHCGYGDCCGRAFFERLVASKMVLRILSGPKHHFHRTTHRSKMVSCCSPLRQERQTRILALCSQVCVGFRPSCPHRTDSQEWDLLCKCCRHWLRSCATRHSLCRLGSRTRHARLRAFSDRQQMTAEGEPSIFRRVYDPSRST